MGVKSRFSGPKGNGQGTLPIATVPLNRAVRAYVEESKRLAAATDSWVSKPELPTSEEIIGLDDDNSVGLVPNQVQGPWASKQAYLQAHYDLLREDAVAPLRDAVAYVRDNPRMKDSNDVCIYEKTYIVGLTCAAAGVAVRVQFSAARAGKNIVWEYSSRLTTGSIVALTPADDAFKSKCIVAVVAARPVAGLKMQPPEIDLFFAQAGDAEFDCQQEWLMVEARTGYYEASRHVLKTLQKMTGESFPMSQYICDLDRTAEPPEYVTSNPAVDMVFFSEDLSQETLKVDILSDWLSSPSALDSSQWSALRQILTKKLAIVQGPPGTGKTFVSVVALKIMLDNMRPGDPPIVIAAQTNHALDQLLRHVSRFEREYVRLGGRSMDEEIKKRSLFEVRRRQRDARPPGGTSGPSRNQQKTLIQKIQEVIAPFLTGNAKNPLSASLFLELGLLTGNQHDSLLKGAEGWVTGGDQIEPVAAWLGDCKDKFEVVYKEETFGFAEDEIDLEYEQLKEQESEHGPDDDEFETLRGPYVPLKESFIGRKPFGSKARNANDQYLKMQDMWKIPAANRGAVYTALQKRAKEIVRDKFRALLKEYNANCVNIKIGNWERDCAILESAKVIGMTTTGLSKYRGLVASIKPKIILIEEAAEVIEAPVTAACVESLEHLILVGDHQQLQGHCALKELEGEPFFLNVSMFERLVHNGIEFKRLSKQRRMVPEIRRILAPIYDNLEDHPSVLNRPGVPGMGDVASFFFCHSWPEASDSLLSKYNEKECQMVVGLYVYLHMNGMPTDQITVLTFYNGQRKKILKALRDQPILQAQPYLKVVTVDSYQGEENEVVILSLVRSSEHGNIGFLSVENRVCVALSRAKRGFYIFGDAESLAVANPLWWEVVNVMNEKPKRIGYHVPLTCVKHGNKTYMRQVEDWKSTNGGCSLKCDETMECGHPCPLRCHTVPHANVRCLKPCERLLPCGHNCTETCFRQCKCNIAECQELFLPPPQMTMPGDIRQEEGEAGMSTSTPILGNNNSNNSNASATAAENHRAFVQRYQEYASGGAQEADARLAAATSQLVIQQQLNRVDEEAYRDLFGAGEEEAGGDELVRTVSATAVEQGGGQTGGPARTKYVQLYSAAAAAASGRPRDGKAGGDEQCLLDLS